MPDWPNAPRVVFRPDEAPQVFEPWEPERRIPVVAWFVLGGAFVLGAGSVGLGLLLAGVW